jgi:hypothetical protein
MLRRELLPPQGVEERFQRGQENKEVFVVRLKTRVTRRPATGVDVIVFRRYDGTLARTASASGTDLSVLWRPSWAIENRNA